MTTEVFGDSIWLLWRKTNKICVVEPHGWWAEIFPWPPKDWFDAPTSQGLPASRPRQGIQSTVAPVGKQLSTLRPLVHGEVMTAGTLISDRVVGLTL